MPVFEECCYALALSCHIPLSAVTPQQSGIPSDHRFAGTALAKPCGWPNLSPVALASLLWPQSDFSRTFFSFLLLWAFLYCHGLAISHLGGENLISTLLFIWFDASFPKIIYVLSLFPGGKKKKKKEGGQKSQIPWCLGREDILQQEVPIIPSCLS